MRDALTAITYKCDLLEQAAKQFAIKGINLPLTQTLVVLRDSRQPVYSGEKSLVG